MRFLAPNLSHAQSVKTEKMKVEIFFTTELFERTFDSEAHLGIHELIDRNIFERYYSFVHEEHFEKCWCEMSKLEHARFLRIIFRQFNNIETNPLCAMSRHKRIMFNEAHMTMTTNDIVRITDGGEKHHYWIVYQNKMRKIYL